MTDIAFRTLGLTKVYQTGDVAVHALRGVDLVLPKGEMCVLLGPSGSGKTTLCSIAGGILSASSGSVSVGGEGITHYSDRQLTSFRQQHVGFVFQSVNLVPFLTARENLLVVDELGRREGRAARQRADRLLEELGLDEVLRNRPAVDGDEGALGAWGTLVNLVGDQLLSRAGLTADQGGDVGSGDFIDRPVDLDHLWARPNDRAEREGLQALSEGFALVAQFVEEQRGL